MKALLSALACLSILGCEIAPVVSAPSGLPGIRYSECDRAAEDYCKHAIKAAARDMDACVAEYRFKCVSSRAKSSTVPRSRAPEKG
jgi:hypothetical protein